MEVTNDVDVVELAKNTDFTLDPLILLGIVSVESDLLDSIDASIDSISGPKYFPATTFTNLFQFLEVLFVP